MLRKRGIWFAIRLAHPFRRVHGAEANLKRSRAYTTVLTTASESEAQRLDRRNSLIGEARLFKARPIYTINVAATWSHVRVSKVL
jgi:hypothetical protein